MGAEAIVVALLVIPIIAAYSIVRRAGSPDPTVQNVRSG
jgi:hypothetical protein